MDQPTSGIILFALNPTAAASLVAQFTQRQVKKYYQALVRGWTHTCGTIPIPLADLSMEASNAKRSKNPPSETLFQPAISHFTTIRWYNPPWPLDPFDLCRYALVEVSPSTGRSHQIRRHLKQIAHPIIGDARHGDSRCNHLFEEKCQLTRMLLSSMLIEFTHPTSHQRLSNKAPRGESFDQVIETLRPYEVTIDNQKLPPQPSRKPNDQASNLNSNLNLNLNLNLN